MLTDPTTERETMTPTEHTLEQRIRLRAAYLDSFGPTEDGALFMEAAEQISTDQTLHRVLVNVLRHISGENWPTVEAGIHQGIEEAFGGPR
jgi:hypothetical protein